MSKQTPRWDAGKAIVCIGMVAFLGIRSTAAEAPVIAPADDAKHFGSMDNVLFWTPDQQVAGYRNMRKLTPTRVIRAGDDPGPLPRNPVELGGVEIRYDGEVMTTDEFFATQNVAGLLVIKNGRVVYERYGLGNTEESRWISWSVAKSVVSLLVGAAIADGYIESVDEKVTEYLPRLKGSSYDEATIRSVLQMSSGVVWNEDYADPDSDVNTASWSTLPLYEYLSKKGRASKPGEDFNYNTAETNLVGTLLRSAIGNNLSTYLSEKIWRPFGMEADAYWNLTEPGGGEFGGCCINATLRDYGRIGLFALRDGRLADGRTVLPDGWMKTSTTPSDAYEGYGYLWWLRRGGAFNASGIFGQGIYIDPAEDVVIAIHSARAHASRRDDWAWMTAMYEALTEAVKSPAPD